MIRENKNATVVRLLLKLASNYTQTHTYRGFQSGHQAVAEVSHGHHVCRRVASRLINNQNGIEGHRKCCVGGGAGIRQAGQAGTVKVGEVTSR